MLQQETKAKKLIPFTSCHLPRTDTRHDWTAGYVKYWTDYIAIAGTTMIIPPDSGDFISAIVIDDPDVNIGFLVYVDECALADYVSKWEIDYSDAINRVPARAVQICFNEPLLNTIILRIQYILAKEDPISNSYDV